MRSVGKDQPKRNPETKVPPHNREAEASVLGAILLRNEAVHQAAEQLNPEDFYIPAHAVIFRAMLALETSGKPIDPVSLEEQLKADGNLERSGGLTYLVDLSNRTPTAENVGYYIEIVKDKSRLRRFIQTNSELVSEALSDPPDAGDFLDRAEQANFELAEQSQIAHYQSARALLAQALDDLKAPPELASGLPTGFAALDKYIGLRPGELTVLAARPSMGKTALALNIAANVSIRQGLPVLFCTLEMSPLELMKRLVCSEARVDANDLKQNGQSPDSEIWERVAMAGPTIHSAPLFIKNMPGATVAQVRNAARRFAVKECKAKDQEDPGPHGLVVVDYLQLMRSRSKPYENTTREVSEISRGLKAIAQAINLPVLALSQLNRDVEKRTDDKRPRLADLRDSGSIEQDADIVLFIYRDSYYKEQAGKDATDNTAEINIAKQRNGPNGKADLTWIGEYTRFENHDGTDREPPLGGKKKRYYGIKE